MHRMRSAEKKFVSRLRPRLGFPHVALAVFAVALAASLLVPHSLAAFAKPPTAAPQTTFSGRAIGLSVTTPLASLTFADTGPLPSSGGVIDKTVVRVDHDLAQAELLLSVTMGFDERAQSDAAVASVTLLPGSANPVTADFLHARSVALCTGASGSSEIVSLAFAGQAIVVTGKPNQVFSVPGVLTLVINEQIDSSQGETNAITVNALHLTLLSGAGEVIVSSAYSDITCRAPPPPTPRDFITGGGFITVNGARGNFGFVAGIKPGQSDPSGHLVYIDHGTGMKVKGTAIDSWSGSDTTRTFSGPATVNGAAGFTFTVTATDNGEPGRGVDMFAIRVWNDHEASGTLQGGNIQLHA